MQSKLHIYSSFWILYCLLWANDTLGNTGNASVAYSINGLNPAVNLLYPSDSLWLSNGSNIDFNFSAQDPNSDGIKNCSLYGNWSGSWALDQTNSTLMSGRRLN